MPFQKISLGVTISSELDWEPHCFIISKAYKMFGLLQHRFSININTASLETIILVGAKL